MYKYIVDFVDNNIIIPIWSYSLLLANKSLDPHRPSRRFSQPKPLEDPLEEIKLKQKARQDKLFTLSEEPIVGDDIDLQKKRAQQWVLLLIYAILEK